MEPMVWICRVHGMPSGWMRGWDRILHGEKAERLRRMPEPKAALSLTGELLARYGVWKWSGVPPTEIRFAVQDSGKPIATFPQGYFFNISHSGDLCACAVAQVPVGVDIQKMEPVRFDAIAKRYFAPQEQAGYQQAEDPKTMFYTLWTKREAIGKCIGVGLRPLPERLPPMQLRWKTLGEYRLCVCWEDRAALDFRDTMEYNKEN